MNVPWIECDKCENRIPLKKLCMSHREQRKELIAQAERTGSQKDWNKLLVFEGYGIKS